MREFQVETVRLTRIPQFVFVLVHLDNYSEQNEHFLQTKDALKTLVTVSDGTIQQYKTRSRRMKTMSKERESNCLSMNMIDTEFGKTVLSFTY